MQPQSQLARWAIDYPIYPCIIAFVCIFGGWWGIETVGRLEDPPFPMNYAYVITTYPGASAEEVSHEVTDVIESALQELPYLEKMISKSVPGRSEVQVEISDRFDKSSLPQIWDELRRRISEAELRLPTGAGTPLVEDDFGDVFGIYYAVAAADQSPKQVRRLSDRVSNHLLSLEGVGKVQVTGLPLEAVYLEIDHDTLVRLGLPLEQVLSTIGRQTSVASDASIVVEQRRAGLSLKGTFDNIDALRALKIGKPGGTEILTLGDIATLRREPIEIPFERVRFNAEPVFTLGVSVEEGENVVDVGQRVDIAISALRAELPLGTEFHPIYRQHQVVETAINTFLRNLLMSIATVIVALCLFMGWRAGAVVGTILMLTVMGTLMIMAIANIELQRISLGALMIAMGMLVDNAIVVVEGMVIGVQKGQSARTSAEAAVSRTQFPLLGATLIGILAFAPIGLSEDKSGHFLVSLFQVVGISLLLSWVLAIIIAPLLGSRLLKPGPAKSEADIYRGWGYAPYRRIIDLGLRQAWLGMLLIIAITGACIWGFGLVKQSFFPTNNTPIYFVDFYLPQGTSIETTEAQVASFENTIFSIPSVTNITTFVGRGPGRFAATIQPEQPNPAYSHLLVEVTDINAMPDAMAATRRLALDNYPNAQIQVRRSEFSPSGPFKMEARFTGPDTAMLRSLGEQVLGLYADNGYRDLQLDWRQPALKLQPTFNDAQAARAMVTRQDLAAALSYGTQGLAVGQFRDQEIVLPVIARAPIEERTNLNRVLDRTVWSQGLGTYVPMRQVVDSFELTSEETLIFRRDRIPMLTARANHPLGTNFDAEFAKIRPQVEAIELPTGYALTWGGEYEGSQEARETLGGRIPITFGIMFFVTILLFGKLKQPIIIWLTVPMTVCGVVISLLLTDLSFTFPSFLGFLSLSGMLIKNCVVLVDEIDKRVAEQGLTQAAIISASISRLRPVVLAAGTTIVGMTPLLGDAFFLEMAVCIMGGLAFSTILIMFAIPLLYWLIKPGLRAAA